MPVIQSLVVIRGQRQSTSELFWVENPGPTQRIYTSDQGLVPCSPGTLSRAVKTDGLEIIEAGLIRSISLAEMSAGAEIASDRFYEQLTADPRWALAVSGAYFIAPILYADRG